MRKPRSISPSALAKYEKQRENYFLTYCSETRLEREPQAQPASVGSAFDAYVKSQLMSDLFGEPCFGELFEKQVEPHNRDFALKAGRHVMENYIACGAYVDLLGMLESAVEEPQFEFDADTTVNGVPIAGKPDCRFVHRGGAHVILDWKVNGYCGKSSTSPSKGFAICRDGLGWDKPTRSHGKSHSLYEPEEFLGLIVNKFSMEDISIDWADQLSMYGWMMGEPVGSDQMVVCIEQVVAKSAGKNGLEDGPPLLRFASHRSRVSPEYQQKLAVRIEKMWESLVNEHIFTDLDLESSMEKCNELEQRALSMLSDGTSEGDFFAKCARAPSVYRGR